MRHGRTAWNAERRFVGASDVPLDEVGRTQAATLAHTLRGESFSRAIASDLARARETAEIVLAGGAPPLEFDRRWREFDFGKWEGLTWAEIVARFPHADEHSSAGGGVVTPGGSNENFDDLIARVAAAVASLRRESPERVLVVTHSGPLHALLHLARDSESEALTAHFEPASINRFSVSSESIDVVRLNDVTRE